MLAPGKAALIVVGIDKDAEQHLLKREVGD
jgi:hypothetical protein